MASQGRNLKQLFTSHSQSTAEKNGDTYMLACLLVHSLIPPCLRCLGNGIAHRGFGLFRSIKLIKKTCSLPNTHRHARGQPSVDNLSWRLLFLVILDCVKLIIKANNHSYLKLVSKLINIPILIKTQELDIAVKI